MTIYSIDATLPHLFEVIKIIYFDCEYVSIIIYVRRDYVCRNIMLSSIVFVIPICSVKFVLK